uniref:Uncharacterized protein n=1 Tax=Ascaris lumbricoides TaxID=6252 RepID=A0A0M3I328_ASCLU
MKVDDHRRLLQRRRRRGYAASCTDRFGRREIPPLDEVRNILTCSVFRDYVRRSHSKQSANLYLFLHQ